MRTMISFFTALLVVLVAVSAVEAVGCTEICQQDKGVSYGAILTGSSNPYQGVTAYSNGNWTGCGCGTWQCVEYVKRFYITVYEVTFGSVGTAANCYYQYGSGNQLQQVGFTRYTNGETTDPPQEDDLLVFGGGSYGHVAIITSVDETNNEVMLIEQNYPGNGSRPLSMSKTNGQYSIEGTSSYPVLGWLRMNVGRFSDGWFNNQCPGSDRFLDAYLLYGGYEDLGLPWDNGSTNYVHCWPDDCGHADRLWLQDFLTEQGQWSQLVYNPDKDTVYPVTQWILEYWHANTGYSNYGPPLGAQIDWTDDYHYQLFEEPDGTWWYIRCNNPGLCNSGNPNQLPDDLQEVLEQTIQIAITDDDDDDDDTGPPVYAIPCKDFFNIPSWEWPDHYFGLIFNGGLSVCGAHGWQGFYCDTNAQIGGWCDKGERTIVDNNCVFTLYTPHLGTYPSVYHSQLVLWDNYSFEVEEGQAYLLTVLLRSWLSDVPRQAVVALTPQDIYNHYNYIFQLDQALARPVTFQVDDTWQEYSFHFIATESDPNAVLRLFSGAEIGYLLIDDITLTEVNPAENSVPLLTFRTAENDEVVVDVRYGEDDNILSLFGSPINRYQAATVSVFVDGWGIYDVQTFDPYGNTIRLPSQDYSQANFIITDTSGIDYWFNIWSWEIIGATLNGSWLDFSSLQAGLPPLVPLGLTFQEVDGSWQVVIGYQTDGSGYLTGLFGGTIRPEQASTVSVFVDGWGVYQTHSFNLAGNVLSLPADYSQANFIITDTSGTDHWFNIWSWEATGATLNGNWLKWR